MLRGNTDNSSIPRGAIDIQYNTLPQHIGFNCASCNICGKS